MFETFQLSNDAFYYLKDGEEPLIDDAIDEALAIEALFPDGYSILDFQSIGNTGYIEARIGPKLKINIAPKEKPKPIQALKTYDQAILEQNAREYYDSDEVLLMTKICRLEIVWLNPLHTELKAYWHRLDTGKRELWDTFKVEVQSDGAKYIKKIHGKHYTQIYLKRFKKVS